MDMLDSVNPGKDMLDQAGSATPDTHGLTGGPEIRVAWISLLGPGPESWLYHISYLGLKLMAEQAAEGPSYSHSLWIWGAMNLQGSPRRAWRTARPCWREVLGLGGVRVGILDWGSVQTKETTNGVRLAGRPELSACSQEDCGF